MTPLKEWIQSPEVKKLKDMPGGLRYGKEFFRDPLRSIYLRPEMFYAAADGIILYAHARVKPDEAIVTIKGRKLTTRDVLDDKTFNDDALVIGTFMTEYDVHVNRVPTSGYVTESHKTPYLFTHNFSMMLEQDELMHGKGSHPDDMGYLFPNERQIVKIYAPRIKCSYYLVQIAERDVDEICNWGYGHQVQGEQYGIVRFGSQVDLIIPLKKNEERFKVLAKENWHVEAGLDPLVEVLK
jgi:phosphatidylserine decarboxylase